MNHDQPKIVEKKEYELTRIAPTIDMSTPEHQLGKGEHVAVTRRERAKNYEWAVLDGEMTYEEAVKYVAELWKDGWDLPTFNEFDGARLNGVDLDKVANEGGFFLKKIPGKDFPQIIKDDGGYGFINSWDTKRRVVLVKRNLPDDSEIIA